MALSKRLQMNADYVPEGTRVADVGCDHGYCSIYLAREKHCSVIALDINQGPLSRAEKNIRDAGLAGEAGAVECRLGNGLSAVSPGEVDCVLIAGMGGMLMGRILNDGAEILRQAATLVLQPQSDFGMVRKTVFSLGFSIADETFLVDAGKPYIAILAKRPGEGFPSGNNVFREKPYSEAEERYGRKLIEKKDGDYYSFLIREREKYKGILKKTEGALCSPSLCPAVDGYERLKPLLRKLRLLDETLAAWGNSGCHASQSLFMSAGRQERGEEGGANGCNIRK